MPLVVAVATRAGGSAAIDRADPLTTASAPRTSTRGAEFDDTFTLADGRLGTGDLSPGEYVYGAVVLEVQEAAQRVRVNYDTAAFGGENLYWLVER